MAELTDIVIDSLYPAALARFWAAALDDFAVRAYDQAEIDRLAGLGYTPESDPTVAVDGPGLTLFFQKTDSPKRQRNRLHLDLRAAHRAREVERLVEIGARIRDVHADHTVLLDPEGNEFCLIERVAR